MTLQRVFNTLRLKSQCFSLLLIVAALSVPYACPQAVPKLSSPRFEVISVRVRNGYDRPAPLRLEWTPNSYIAEGISLLWIIAAARHVRFEEVQRLPAWADTSRFDIIAKAPAGQRLDQLTSQDRNEMLNQILLERFHFNSHMETKPSAAYDLVLARSGIRITPSPDGSTPLGTKPDQRLIVGNGRIVAKNITMSRFVPALSSVAGRKVIDKTGLSGQYTFTVDWSPSEEFLHDPGDGAMRPPLAEALKQDLGLLLVPSQTTVSYVVIDKVEFPSDN